MDRERAIRAIEDNLPAIAKNGTLVCRNEPGRQPSWSLRFRAIVPEAGARKHRRIDLGDDAELIALVRQAIDCRERIRAERHATDAARSEEARRLRAMEDEVMAEVEGSRRYRQGVRKAYREYCAAAPKPDLNDARAYIGGLTLARRSPGRPLKSRLW